MNAAPTPLVASVTMGYGHLRAAYPIADLLGAEVKSVDRPPLAEPGEVRLWEWVRRAHELLSKPIRGLGLLDKPTRRLMDAVTMIPPLHEARDHSAATWSVRLLDQLIQRGLGRGMIQELQATGAPLVTTFYAPALVADRAGIEHVYCVVTDADCNRIWAPLDAQQTRIQYIAPTHRVVRRLQSFGVPPGNIHLAGFPLPPSLTEENDVTSPRARLAGRLQRLDPRGNFRRLHHNEVDWLLSSPGPQAKPEPIALMFAVGGAGAQAEMVRQFLPSLRPRIVAGELMLQLAAGTRPEVLDAFTCALEECGLKRCLGREVHILFAPTFREYYEAQNRAFLRTDILWTKPSEMSFYPAVGVPCILSPPVGAHERYNRSFLREQGIGLKQLRADWALGWIEEWLEDGTLAAAAWSGYLRLPKHGAREAVRIIRREAPSPDGSECRTPKHRASGAQ